MSKSKRIEVLKSYQENLIIVKYKTKFSKLFIFAIFAIYITDDESRKTKRFKMRLRLIRNRISALKLRAYTVDKAIIIERDIEKAHDIRGKNGKDNFINKNKRGNELENANKRIKSSIFEKGKLQQKTQSYVKCRLNHKISQCF